MLNIGDRAVIIYVSGIHDNTTNIRVGDTCTVAENKDFAEWSCYDVELDKPLIEPRKENGCINADGTYTLWARQLKLLED